MKIILLAGAEPGYGGVREGSRSKPSTLSQSERGFRANETELVSILPAKLKLKQLNIISKIPYI